MKKTTYTITDTETCPIIPTDKVDAHNMLVYDWGWKIIDKKNNEYVNRSFIVEEIFFGQYQKMKSSYYANKLPQYYRDIADQKRIVKSFVEIVKIFKEDMKKYGSKIVSAHNAYFDYTSLRNTAKFLNLPNLYPFPYDSTIWDTMKMARDTICKNKTYCFYTAKGQKSATAENLYRYISQNYDFEESHTALEDVNIESEILLACLRTHKKMNKKLWKD